jgi:hypothetical protein
VHGLKFGHGLGLIRLFHVLSHVKGWLHDCKFFVGSSGRAKAGPRSRVFRYCAR